MAKCVLCGETAEEPDQPEGAELCNACAVHLDGKFAPLANVLCDPALEAALNAEERKK